jgi:hypothetical protein
MLFFLEVFTGPECRMRYDDLCVTATNAAPTLSGEIAGKEPLPIPERKWREIAIDFIEKPPSSESCANMMVIIDRLGKGIVLDPLEKLNTDHVA